MRIDSNRSGQVPESEPSAPSSQAASSGSSAAGGVPGQDQAQLSGAHTLVQALAAEASQLPEVREEKVSALRQAVESGSYQTSSEKVAEALFSHLWTARAA
jgi:flagellar biosynthesis anti-sigma factor FlgM